LEEYEFMIQLNQNRKKCLKNDAVMDVHRSLFCVQ
jgi:hypothetical protein